MQTLSLDKQNDGRNETRSRPRNDYDKVKRHFINRKARPFIDISTIAEH